MAENNTNDQAVKLGIDPSGYGPDDDSQARLQERIKTVQAERDSFDNEEARGGPIPRTVIGKNSISGQTTPTGEQEPSSKPVSSNTQSSNQTSNKSGSKK